MLDEPTNHLDVGSIAALLDAIESYGGALVVVSHDRPFCDALRCTHVGYVADGACRFEERELRDDDFSEADRGVRNAEISADNGGASESAVEAKARREEERRQQKQRAAAPKKIAKLEASIGEAEAQIEQLDNEMVAAGSDMEALTHLGARRDALQGKVDAWYAEWDELESLLVRVQ
uniref:ABC transporter Uup C-terminal domain-containing protein n=1 Tax=Prymnesium polylepis TaxID=72548 RepID=A0A7S4MUE9_9EUKA